ncbi:MAG: basic amino acid ABC transporter substrate-binding protein [Lachnospiraceae bacterium]|nr:basic amino acid ABC transporter substrate-binding protein [Lachnospiraceae bacterium]
MMKKMIAMMLAGTMALSLAACGSAAAPAPAADTAAEETAEAAAEDTTEAAEEDTEADINTVTDGVLTMATNAYFPPYEYYEGDAIVGIDAEIAAAVAEKLGLELKIEDMEFDSIITAVTAGKADMGLAGMTVTEERKQNVNFSDSYATGIQAVVVPEDSDIATVDDLTGKKIGVQLGTTGDIYCSGDYGEENVEKFNKGNDAIMALVTGKVDAVVIDNEPAKSYVAANEGLKILETEYAVEDYAACIAKENTALLDAVNAALAELKADGTLDQIVAKYISAE